MIKKIVTILLLSVLVFCTGYKKPSKYVIKAEKDAFYHNNVGLNYLKDRMLPGEEIFGEIAGWVDENTPIMATANNKKINDIIII